MDKPSQVKSCCNADVPKQPSCCCGGGSCGPSAPHAAQRPDWIVGKVNSPVGEVPQVATGLRFADRLGAWKMRWGIGRMRYRIDPGLYAVGQPTPDSPVLVSANYKLSFDALRRELEGLDAWILVIDTKGINVWCAAGKGTFGTDEIVRCVGAARLAEIVAHRTLIVPQLGAPGVAAHEVKRLSGFRVVYGPVRAADLRAFLSNGMQATPEMRAVRFTLSDRVAVIPVELVHAAKAMTTVAVGLFLAAGLGRDGYDPSRMLWDGSAAAAVFLGAFLGSVVFVPILLPWLPGRALALKGACFGAALVAVLLPFLWFVCGRPMSGCDLAACWLAVPTITSFVAMSFSGSTTYTSLSGVRREMRFVVPMQLAAALAGMIVWLVGRFVHVPPL